MSVFLQTLQGDLAIVAGQLVLVKDPVVECAHKIRNTLLLFAGEWFLDTRLGIPWFQVVLQKNPDIDSIRRLLSSAIKEASPLVQEVIRLDLEEIPALRTLTVRFEVRTTAGDAIAGSLSGDIFVNGTPVYVAPAPVFSSATPAPASGGTITITGANFQPSAVVTSSFALGATTYLSSTSLSVSIPAHTAGVFPLTITQPSGTVTGAGGLVVTSVAPVLSLASTVPLAGGDLYITGTGFTGASVAWVDGVAQTTTLLSPTQLKATGLPAHAAGTVSVYVVDGGASNTIAAEYWDAYSLAYSGAFDARDALSGLYWPDHVLGMPGNEWYANAVAWTTVSLGGKTHRLPADAMSLGQGYKTSGGAFQVYADLLGDTTSWTLTFEGSFPSAITGGSMTTGYSENQIYQASNAANSGCQVWMSKAGGVDTIRVRVGSTVISAPYVPAQKCVIQVRYVYSAGTPAASSVSMRINTGAWTAPVGCGVASSGGNVSGYPVFMSNPDGTLPGWDDNNNGACGIGWAGFMQSAISDSNADRLVYWAASEFGVAL